MTINQDFFLNSLDELNLFLKDNEKYIWEIEKISDENRVYYYLPSENSIVKFDHNIEKGWKFNYTRAQEEIQTTQNYELRDILAELWGGIELSRKNYILEQDRVKKLDANFEFYNNILCENLELEKEELFNSNFFEKIDALVENKTKEELLLIEIPLVALFSQYALKGYDAKIKLNPSQNQFKEKYYSIFITYDHKKNLDINLSRHVFKSLFPEGDDTKVQVSQIKKVIEFFLDKKIRFEH